MRKIYAFLLVVILYTAANGQVGFPDKSFGNNGSIATTMAATGNSSTSRVVKTFLLQDSKILLVIQKDGKTVIGKKLPDGTPDLGFGKDGFSELVSIAPTAAVLQPDGKIVVAGGNAEFMLARYNADGSLDKSFGNGGIAIADITPSDDFLTSVAITATGGIIAAGNSTGNFMLVAFTSTGMRDPSFGINAVATTNFNGMNSSINAICLQADGKIIAAGYVNSPSGSDFALARYNADGSPDPGFNGTGRTSTDFGGWDVATAIVPGGDGKIYAGGSSADFSGNQHFRVARYNTDGSPDETYNSGTGSVLAAFGNSYDVLTCIGLQIDGSVVAGGNTNINPVSNDIALVHINTDGTIDKNFGNNGLVLADINSQNDECGWLVVQPDGKILTGGASTVFVPLYQSWFTCLRFDANGNPDPGFARNGVLQEFIPQNIFAYSALMVQPDNKLLAAGEWNDGANSGMFISRFEANGLPDASYGDNCRKELAFESGCFAFEPDGKLLRISFSPANNGDFSLLRYNADGSLDIGFGTGGKVISDFGGNESASKVVFQADGKMIIGGLSRDDKGSDWLIVRYNYDGSIDGSFGTNGIVRKNTTNDENLDDLVIAPDGRILVGGTGFTYPPDFSYFKMNTLIARLNPDGSFDNGFGNNGMVILERGNNNGMGTMVVQNNFKIVFTYFLQDQFAPQQTFLERLNADGTADTEFGINGKILQDGFLIKLQPDQKILVSGSAVNELNNNDYTLSRFTKDGLPDPSFGTNGKTIASFTGLDNNLYNSLLNGDAFFGFGSGTDKWGQMPGVIAKFSLEPINVVTCPGNKEVNTDPNTCSVVVYDIDPLEGCKPGSTISYALTGATVSNGTCTASGAIFNKGITMVTYSAGDGASSCSFNVTVVDKELPAIENLSTGITTIWPPDHKMKDVTLSYNLHDNCGIAGTQVTVSCNEPITVNDWQVVDDHHIRLRAERKEGGNGRIYTITVTVTDISGNQTSKTVPVTVSKNQANIKIDITAQPNPSSSYFAVAVVPGYNSKTGDKITVKIYNSYGFLLNEYDNVAANTILKVGDKFLPGLYYLEATQSGVTKTTVLIKQ